MKNFILLYVKDAMTKDVVSIEPNTGLREVKSLFERHDYNSLPVIEEGKLVGIVTKLDFIKHFIITPKSMIPNYDALLDDAVETVMNETPLTVSPETPLTRVLELMVETKLRSFPVVDSDMEVLGIVSREDVVKRLG
ncbi:MAG: CBS domain-containing protein [Deltaproteobacteria bacterium]|uniref:CBS domain-containing protein n=1 Tax=Candidatus Zymogenus saltonus TaxID=2844893 RepID=A0A9D8KAT3_9DELT|nr:CBS domain-containing protein [Candidatus Zymogenus saltonus]